VGKPGFNSCPFRFSPIGEQSTPHYHFLALVKNAKTAPEGKKKKKRYSSTSYKVSIKFKRLLNAFKGGIFDQPDN
jgi:hypothetical protein